MKGLSSMERVVLECIGRQRPSYRQIQEECGLHENVCFNVLQALIIRGIITTDGVNYQISETLSPLMLEEINGQAAKEAETLELMEALLTKKGDRTFKLRKVAMDERDERILLAMLSNLESFLQDAHKKAQSEVPLKERKVVFWGVGQVHELMTQIMAG